MNIKLPGHSHREIKRILLKKVDKVGFARRFGVGNVERLVKYSPEGSFSISFAVASRREAWIEIRVPYCSSVIACSRFPQGSVD